MSTSGANIFLFTNTLSQRILFRLIWNELYVLKNIYCQMSRYELRIYGQDDQNFNILLSKTIILWPIL
jgi:hypothetical protein